MEKRIKIWEKNAITRIVTNGLKKYLDRDECKERREENEKINSHYERMEKRIKIMKEWEKELKNSSHTT